MRVLILTEGGINIGFGHITRCLSIYHAFQENGVTPEFLVNSDESASGLLKGANYKLFNWLREKDPLRGRTLNADVVLIDSYLAGISFYRKIARTAKIAVYMDDTKRLDYPRGIVINGSVCAAELGYPAREGIRHLLGTDYMPLRREFWKTPRKVINKEIKKILITFGGREYSDFPCKLAEYLEGRGTGRVIRVIDSKNRVNTAGMRDLMLEVDLCVSGGGQTTYELARCGVPTIGVCFADNQLWNLKGWSKSGFLYFAGWCSDKKIFEDIEGAIGKLTYERRVKISRIGRGFVDGRGAKRVVAEILSKTRDKVKKNQ